jgi:GntR family transcriptional regulator
MSEGASSGSAGALAADLAREAPLYQRCLGQIADEITSGRLSPGTRLRSERALAASLGYTRLTVRRSLHELARLGLIDPAGTRGWQVRDSPFSEPPNTLMSFTELARSRGLTASARPLNLVERDATVDEADQLRVAPGSLVIECTRLRCMDDEPIAIEKLRLSLSRFPWLAELDWNGSVHDALRAHGVLPARANVFVDVVAADADQSELLQLPGSQHLLRVTSATSDADGVPVSLDEIVYHPHRYRFHAVLTKTVGEASS